ncbi:uncharacterized protein LOC135839948 isoform X3 [Planococcus citri]
MKDLHIDDYNPWGKPGHGAPNEDTLRKRKIFMDVLPPVVLKAVGNDATMMGRPGGGAPVRTKSGKLKNARVEDPQLRFQWHGPVRKMVDIDLRYRVPVADQKAYKEELDQLVKEKKVIERETACHDDIKDHQMGSDANTFRRLGSHPQDNKDLYEKFPHIDEAIRLEQITGGIELEPLLAIRRRKAKRYPLGTSDVTGIMDIKPKYEIKIQIQNISPLDTLCNEKSTLKKNYSPCSISITDKEYSEALEQQITAREHHKQEEKEEDQMTARKHFENWDTFWGRPGHGAPKPVKVKENLEYILYQLPILIKKEGMGHEDEEHDQESEKSEN